MKVRYKVNKKCKYGDLVPGDIFITDYGWHIKTDCDTAVSLGNGTEVSVDNSCLVGVSNNAELVIRISE